MPDIIAMMQSRSLTIEDQQRPSGYPTTSEAAITRGDATVTCPECGGKGGGYNADGGWVRCWWCKGTGRVVYKTKGDGQ